MNVPDTEHVRLVRAYAVEGRLLEGEFPSGPVLDPLCSPAINVTPQGNATTVILALVAAVHQLQARVAIIERAHGLVPERDERRPSAEEQADLEWWCTQGTTHVACVACEHCKRKRVQAVEALTPQGKTGLLIWTRCRCSWKTEHTLPADRLAREPAPWKQQSTR